ncbi:MAG: DUF4136 domain-containing protein [Bacteroidales bacterium]|nr:DUF4136 domain-containing protein [Bacteroidales bacterium]
MKKRILSVFAAVLLLSSCGPSFQLVQSNVYNDANLASYQTFSFMPWNSEDMPKSMSEIDYNNIATAIINDMQERGYKYVPKGGQIEINIGVSEKLNVQTIPAIPPAYQGTGLYGYRWYGPRAAYLNSYYSNANLLTGVNQEGLLTIDMVDAKKNAYIFSSTVGSIFNKSMNVIQNTSQIQQAVNELFKKFPVKPIGSK